MFSRWILLKYWTSKIAKWCCLTVWVTLLFDFTFITAFGRCLICKTFLSLLQIFDSIFTQFLFLLLIVVVFLFIAAVVISWINAFLFMSYRMFYSPLDLHFCTMSTILNCIHRSVQAIAKHRKFYIQVSVQSIKLK